MNKDKAENAARKAAETKFLEISRKKGIKDPEWVQSYGDGTDQKLVDFARNHFVNSVCYPLGWGLADEEIASRLGNMIQLLKHKDRYSKTKVAGFLPTQE